MTTRRRQQHDNNKNKEEALLLQKSGYGYCYTGTCYLGTGSTVLPVPRNYCIIIFLPIGTITMILRRRKDRRRSNWNPGIRKYKIDIHNINLYIKVYKLLLNNCYSKANTIPYILNISLIMGHSQRKKKEAFLLRSSRWWSIDVL